MRAESRTIPHDLSFDPYRLSTEARQKLALGGRRRSQASRIAGVRASDLR
jgi:tRNA U34 5-carboxymethylaminomethyl modifying enzyme MnmG/GidA